VVIIILLIFLIDIRDSSSYFDGVKKILNEKNETSSIFNKAKSKVGNFFKYINENNNNNTLNNEEKEITEKNKNKIMSSNKKPILRLNTNNDLEELNENLDLINDFDAPEGAEFVEILIEQLKCGDKYYIRQIKNYYTSDGSHSYIVKIDGLEKN